MMELGAVDKSKALERKPFYDKISRANMAPLWEVLNTVIRPTPATPCQPYLWPWETAWPWLQEAGDVITAKEAERRVLVLENPGLRGKTRITHSLYAGLQIIMPGEMAPAHRHSQTALRFVMHGQGAYTAVDGEKVTMSPGDLVITPSWTFHDHGNPASEPMVWMDVLDLPIVELLDTQFAEKAHEEFQSRTVEANTNLAQFGNTMLPVEYTHPTRTSPLFWYPYSRTREALRTMQESGEPHECWGHKLHYINPVNGKAITPTIGTFMQLLPAGFKGKTYRATDSTVYSVVEGKGRCIIEDQVFEFGPRDVFICPSWKPYRLEADADAVLFSCSDRPIQQVLDLWRESFS